MQLTIAIHAFNEKVRQMNQSNSKQIVLSAQEARNLHADLFSLMSELSVLAASKTAVVEDVVTVNVDGGGF